MGKPKEPKHQPTWKEIVPFMVFLGTCVGILLYVYFLYGSSIFFHKGYFDMKWSAEDWRRHLDANGTRKVLLIGGPHKAGTTILWEAIKHHPDISGFGDRFETGVDFSEGILLQSGLVYPRFGVGLEFRHGQDGNRMAGLGKYALDSEEKVHWTSDNSDNNPGKSKISPNNFKKLLNRFGPYWNDLNATILVEKSPPNAVISRFLEALYNVPVDSDDSSVAATIPTKSTSTSKPKSITKHLFITRHPIANIYAHDKILRGTVSFRHLFENYIKVHEYMFQDMPLLQNKPMLVRLEDFAANPVQILTLIFEWLEVDASYDVVQDTIDALTRYGRKIDPDPNQKYIQKWCDREQINQPGKEGLLQLQQQLDSLKGLNYDVIQWCEDRHKSKISEKKSSTQPGVTSKSSVPGEF